MYIKRGLRIAFLLLIPYFCNAQLEEWFYPQVQPDITSQIELSLPSNKWVKRSDYVAFGLSVLGGVANGMSEAYEADRRIFEKRWGVSPQSWWGSESWKRKHKDYDGGDERPAFWQSKDLLVWVTDFDHAAEDARYLFTGTSFFIIGLNGGKRKYKWWEHAIRLGINTGAFIAASSITYNSLRY